MKLARFESLVIAFLVLLVSVNLALACSLDDEIGEFKGSSDSDDYADYGNYSSRIDQGDDYDDHHQNNGTKLRASCKGTLCKFYEFCGKALLNNRSPKRNEAHHRIVNGKDVTYGHWPSYAYVKSGDSICGGVLITDRHVLTAGHCVIDNPMSLLSVVLGEHTLNTKDKYEQRFKGKLVSYILAHDWAVLYLAKRPELSSYVEPACMPLNARVDPSLCYVVGMGLRTYSKGKHNVMSDVVQELPVIETRCETWVKNISNFDESRSCWSGKGNKKGTACKGDSGGPILCLDSERQPRRWRVAGLVSHRPLGAWCDGSGPNAWVSVYTKIPNLMKDILSECDL